MTGARRFTELAAWQRAHELYLLSEELLNRPRVRRDVGFTDQLSRASASGPRNIAEGFGRYRPKENAQFVRVAKGSANEVLALFIEAKDKGYLTERDFPRFQTTAKRTIGTLVPYLRYLDGCDPNGPWNPAKRKQPKQKRRRLTNRQGPKS